MPPAAEAAAPAGGEVNFDFFFNALQDNGQWLSSQDYGYVFQPKVAAEKADWRPYTDGYWSYTDQGWTWVSYEDFGWATYHYGRWTKIDETGWVWVPGYEWAPAWVSWRTDSRYAGGSAPPPPRARRSGRPAVAAEEDFAVGWAPLPPEAAFDYGAGISPRCDVQYDIGPAWYSFVPVRYFGAAGLLPYYYPYDRGGYYYGSTVNCTNLAYTGGYIYAGGPSYARLSPVVLTPIPRLVLERRAAFATRGIAANQVQGNRLLVTAPAFTRPAGLSPGAVGVPLNASAKPGSLGRAIGAGRVQRGWDPAVVPADRAQALRNSIRQQAARVPARAVAPRVSVLPNRAITVGSAAGARPGAITPGARPDRVLPGTAPVGAAGLNPGAPAAAPSALTPSLTRQQAARQAAVERRAQQETQRQQAQAARQQRITEQRAARAAARPAAASRGPRAERPARAPRVRSSAPKGPRVAAPKAPRAPRAAAPRPAKKGLPPPKP